MAITGFSDWILYPGYTDEPEVTADYILSAMTDGQAPNENYRYMAMYLPVGWPNTWNATIDWEVLSTWPEAPGVNEYSVYRPDMPTRAGWSNGWAFFIQLQSDSGSWNDFVLWDHVIGSLRDLNFADDPGDPE